MVHEKYIKKGGKLFGPYLYNNKRVNGKVVTTYVGKNEPKETKLHLLFFIAVILCFILLLLILESSSGNVVIDMKRSYVLGEKLTGDIKLVMKSGELLPADSIVSVRLSNFSMNYSISEIISSEKSNGNYYLDGMGLQGTGEGFGLVGKKVTYPIVKFKIRVYENVEGVESNQSEEESNSGNESVSTESNSSVESIEDNETSTDENTETTTSEKVEEQESDSTGSETPIDSGESESETSSETGSEISPDSTAEDSGSEQSGDSIASDSSSSSSDSGSSSVTGQAVGGIERIIEGEVSDGQEFEIELNERESAELAAGSVYTNDSNIEDSYIKINLEDGKAFVSSAYKIEEDGFGEDFIGNNTKNVIISLGKLGIPSSDGLLNVQVIYNHSIIIDSNEEIKVIGNLSSGNVSLIKEIPMVRADYNSNVDINITEYIGGADEYLLIGQNLTGKTSNGIMTITPDKDFKGAVRSSILAYSWDGESRMLSNTFNVLVSSGAVNVTTTRSKIRVGEPVKWTKNITMDVPEEMNVELPLNAENITVTKFEEEGSSVVATGNVIMEFEIKGEPFIKRFAKSFRYGLTGKAVFTPETQSEEVLDVPISADANNYVIEYYTPAPEMSEENLSETEKNVVISGPDEITYTDIIASVNVSDIIPVEKFDNIRVYWNNASQSEEELKDASEIENETVVESEKAAEISSTIINRVEMPFDYYDLDLDGKIDYIEWVVPHLSNQSFSIILITNAVHLDSNRTMINDVFDQVYTDDGIWTDEIPAEDYIRVKFEKNLTSMNDITLRARSSHAGAVIEVYEKDRNTKIADFGLITESAIRKVYLSSMSGSNDEFDLKVVGNPIEFDYIVDPADDTPPNISFGTSTPANGASTSLSLAVNITTWDASDHYSFLDIDRSLMLWYRFDDVNGSGDLIDLSRFSNNGSAKNGANRTNGIFNKSFGFDGSNDYIDVPVSGLSSVQTKAMWINLTDLASNLATFLIDEGIEDAEFNNYLSFVDPDSDTKPSIRGAITSDHVVETTFEIMEANTWVFVAETVNSSGTMSIYINGVLNATGSVDQTAATPGNRFVIGSQGDVTTNFFKGRMDELLIFNRSLSAAEISSLYNATAVQYFNNFTGISVGDHTIKGYAMDASGNMNETSVRTITITDVSVPGITIMNPTVNQNFKFAPVTFNITVNENATANYTLTGGLTNYTMSAVNGTYFNAANMSLAEGNYTARFYVTDLVGNLNATAVVNFSVFDWPPYVNILSPSNRSFHRLPLVFNITTDENATTNYTLTGGLTNYTMTKVNRTYYNGANTSIADGTYTVRIYSTNDANRLNGSVISTFTVDTIPSAINFTNPAPANGANLTTNTFTANVTSSDTNNHYSFIDYDNGLMAWHRFDDTSGNTSIDLGPNGNNGTLNGTLIVDSGRFGKAGKFDGIDDALIVNYSNSLNNAINNSVTISVWVYPTSNLTGARHIVSKGDTGGIILKGIGTRDVAFQISENSLRTFNEALPLNAWTHIAASYNKNTSEAKIYINGIINNTGSYSTYFSLYPTDELMIGFAKYEGSHFNGSIDEVMMFNRSLSAAEISSLYNATAGQLTSTFTEVAGGNHTYRAYAVDAAGNKNQTEFRSASLTEVPLITVHSPISNGVYTTRVILFNASITRAGIMNYSLDNGVKNFTMSPINTSLNTTFNATNLTIADGVYTATFYAVEANGNKNSFTSRFSVDTVAPPINFTAPTIEGGETAGDPQVPINITSLDVTTNTYTFLNVDNTLKLWLRMDEQNSNGFVDSSPASNNATNHNGATQFNNSVIGKGAYFDWTMPQYLRTTSNIGISGDTERTVSAWFRLDRDGTNGPLVSFGDSTNTGTLNYLHVTSIEGNGILTLSTNVGDDLTGLTQIRGETWYHAAMTYDGDTAKIYLNGVLEASKSFGGLITTDGKAIMGSASGEVGDSLLGKLDEVMIFNRSLDASEIASLYNSTANSYDVNITGMASGTHTIRGWTSDFGGNINSTAIRTFTYPFDTRPLTVSITSPLENDRFLVTAGSPIEIPFNITLNKNGSVIYSFDYGVTNRTMSTSNNINFFDKIALNYAGYNVSFYINESNGNSSRYYSRVFGVYQPSSGSSGSGSTGIPILDECKDSDGGSNYYKKGIVTGSLIAGDVCIDSKVLAEYSCDGYGVLQEFYTCDLECSSGACTKAKTSEEAILIVNEDSISEEVKKEIRSSGIPKEAVEKLLCGEFESIKPLNAEASSHSGFPASNAIDNNMDTSWYGLFGEYPKSIQFDLGEKKCIKAVDLYFYEWDIPINADIEVSNDGESWKKVISGRTFVFQRNVNVKMPETIIARYVRVQENSGSREYGGLDEISFRAAELKNDKI